MFVDRSLLLAAFATPATLATSTTAAATSTTLAASAAGSTAFAARATLPTSSAAFAPGTAFAASLTTLAASATLATSRTALAAAIVSQKLLLLLSGTHLPAPTAGPNLRGRSCADAKGQDHRSCQPFHLFHIASSLFVAHGVSRLPGRSVLPYRSSALGVGSMSESILSVYAFTRRR
jgi:hypothetical protein